jgi:hypothetical protein
MDQLRLASSVGYIYVINVGLICFFASIFR